MSKRRIRPVATKADLDAFIQASWDIQGSDPCWVPPLRADVRHLLEASHPFWSRAERELFLAERDGKVVGRIAAIKDHAFITQHSEQAGAFGFFECERDADTAKALFATAADWCRGRELALMRGPFNPSTNYEIGTLVEGFDSPPLIMMPHNPPWYPELLEACGLSKEKDLFAYRFERGHKVPEAAAKRASAARANPDINILYTRRGTLKHNVGLMCELFNAAWKDNWGYVPMDPAEVRLMAKDVDFILSEKLAFTITVKGEPAALIMFLPDVNPLLRRLNGSIGLSGVFKFLLHRQEMRGTRLLLCGIKPEFRKLGLSYVLLDYMQTQLFNNPRYDYHEISWVLEDNTAMNDRMLSFGGRRSKRYRIYRMEL
jgi:hypothetical protein